MTGITILHLSDLHFGNKNRFQGRDLKEFGHYFALAVQEALKEEKWPQKPDFLVVTGDFAEVAHPDEFADAHKFLRALVDGLQLDLSQTIFIPGNHDYSWVECEMVDLVQRIKRFSDLEKEAEYAATKFKYYQEFMAAFYGWKDIATPEYSPGYQLLHPPSGAHLRDFDINGCPISFAALNTSETETHRRHGGEMTEAQAKTLIDAWMKPKYHPYLKIALVHHNPSLTPFQNLDWTLDDYVEKLKASRLNPADDWLGHYTADVAGFKGAQHLRTIVHHTGAHLVLHGHHHTPNPGDRWENGTDHNAPVLSVGSFGLEARQIPPEQPLTCQIIRFALGDSPRIRAVPLVFDPNLPVIGLLDKGGFRRDEKSLALYDKPFTAPVVWKAEPTLPRENPEAIEKAKLLIRVERFDNEYRKAAAHLFDTYDLRNLNASPVSMRKHDPKLEEIYLPLRFHHYFNINATEWGNSLGVDELWKVLAVSHGSRAMGDNGPIRLQSIALTGAAGSGKTTWLRYTFRQLLRSEKFLPLFVELRSLAKFLADHNTKLCDQSIEVYLEQWISKQCRSSEQVTLRDLMEAPSACLPTLLVDGWDELGELGADFRSQLLGLLNRYPRLLAITTSRPYGEGRPSSSDGFLQLQVQPLNPAEIDKFALTFYDKCFGEELDKAEQFATQFSTAVRHSQGAAQLVKTPLMLTMMLVISRFKKLPDRRHELYEDCLWGLLDRARQQVKDGAILTYGEWCPDDEDEIRQAVAELAFNLQSNHKSNQGLESVIIAPRSTLLRYLPERWKAKQKQGFLIWLCARAGIMIDDVADNLNFAHLSFQEFLTAWHLNNNFVGPDALTQFRIRALGTFWWETLLLWSAMLHQSNKSRAEPLVQTALEKDALLPLALMMLADGVGSDEQTSIGARALATQLCETWPSQADRCFRAWQASQQTERREKLTAVLAGVALGANWLQWLRLDQARCGIGAPNPLPVNQTASVKNSPLLVLHAEKEPASPIEFIGARVLAGADFILPGYPVNLLALWPSARRRQSLDVQRLGSLGIPLSEIWDWMKSREEEQNPLISNDRPKGLARDLARALARDLARDLALDSASDLARAVTRASDRALARDLARDGVHTDLARARARARARDSDRVQDLALSLALNLVREREMPSGSEPPEVASIMEAAFILQCTLRSSLAGLTLPSLDVRDKKELPLALLMPACFVSCTSGKYGTDEFNEILNSKWSKQSHPFWPAFARHIARWSTPEDKALLEDCARQPENGPEDLYWGLKYIVRGDIILADGTEVTFDQLCEEAGVDPATYPLLEDMPPELELE